MDGAKYTRLQQCLTQRWSPYQDYNVRAAPDCREFYKDGRIYDSMAQPVLCAGWKIQTETVTLAAGTLNPDSTESILAGYMNIQIQGETLDWSGFNNRNGSY